MHQPQHYRNPVFNRPFPDPFVLKFGDTFYGYSTGVTESRDLAFPVIRSQDLVEWESIGGAMAHLEPAPLHYWAPEVTYANGQFYLFYSCGNETFMEIRVATSRRPDGGFVDSGVRMTNEDFAIDPHVFIDEDSERYLFYATDFLSHTHIGTGTVVDRLLDWNQLAGKPRPVTRPRFDWQVYDPRRAEKGNVRWHTVEGPSVFKRKGKYFQMFSGGNWKNASYGVGYAVSENLLDSHEWNQPIDGVSGLPVLRSSDQVVGPGHNSIITGPNSRELFCVYHSWISGERVMSVDRLDVVGERIILLGPTVDPQPAPFPSRPLRSDAVISSNFLLSTTFRLVSENGQIRLAGKDGQFEVTVRSDGLNLAPATHGCDADLFEYQNLSVESNAGRIRVLLNGRMWGAVDAGNLADLIRVEVSVEQAEMLTEEVTEGFVDLFDHDASSAASGWNSVQGQAGLAITNGALVVDEAATVTKGACFADFETAVNIRSLGENEDLAYGFVLLSGDDRGEIRFEIQTSDKPRFRVISGDGIVEIPFPDTYSATEYRQFRFLKIGGSVHVDLEGFPITKMKISSAPSRIGIVTLGASVAVEMVRTVRIA